VNALARLGGPLPVAVAFVVSVVATAAALLAVGLLNGTPPTPEPAAAPLRAPIPVVAPPPPTEALPPPTDDTVSPTASSPTAATVRPPAPTAALSAPLPPSFAAPDGGLGGLPVLPAGLPAALPETALTPEPAGPETPARPVARPAPRYPSAAQRKGIEGHVIVRLRVDARGRVTDVVVIEGSPAGVFDEVARETARRYRFEPARRNGAAVASTIEQRIVFRLRR
jgi:protein TonB